MTHDRDNSVSDQAGRDRARESSSHGNDVSQDAGSGAAPTPEATGSIPLSIAPTGGPAPLGAPVGEPPEETRRLALWVAAGVVVLVILVGLIVWL